MGLADEEQVGALGLVRRVEGRLVPTIAGLLILGNESALREHLPTHEVAFQVLEGTDVRVNEFRRMPLLKTFEWGAAGERTTSFRDLKIIARARIRIE
jgi:ATP-dependent DNA helicase RecG